MLLTRDLICERLGGCTWRTAHKRLTILGLTPKKVGREYYLLEADLEQAVSGKAVSVPEEPKVEPDFSALDRIRKPGRPKKQSSVAERRR